MYTGLLSNFFLILLLNLFQIVLWFPTNWSYLTKRDKFSFIKFSSLCTSYFWKHYTWSNFYYLCNKWKFKSIFTEWKLVWYYYFVNIYNIYWNQKFVVVKLVFFDFCITKHYNFFIQFNKYLNKFIIICLSTLILWYSNFFQSN